MSDPYASNQRQTANADPYAHHERQPWQERILPDIGIGSANLLRSVASIPYETLKAASKPNMDPYEEGLRRAIGDKEHLINPETAEKFRPPEVNQEWFGLRGEPTFMDKAIQKGVEYGLPFATAPRATYGALRAGSGILGRAAGAAGRSIEDVLPLTRGRAAAPIRTGLNQIAEAGNPVTPLSEDIIHQARTFLETPGAGPLRATIEPTLQRAIQGDAQAIFDLQSSMGNLANDLSRFPSFGTERAYARGAREVQQNILGDFYRGLREHGLGDAAENISRGRGRYANYHSYAKNLRNAIIGIGGGYVGLPRALTRAATRD